MKNIPKSALICWIIGILFFLVSFSFLPAKSYAEFTSGIAIAGALAFVGFRLYKKKAITQNTTTYAPLPQIAQDQTPSKPIEPPLAFENQLKTQQKQAIDIAFESVHGFDLKYSYSDVKIADPQIDNLNIVAVGSTLDVYQEGEELLEVYFSYKGKKLGYLPNNKLQEMVRDYRERDDWVQARMAKLDPPEVALGFYMKVKTDFDKLINSDAKRKIYKLTGNKKEEYQSNISFCTVGEEVTATYDYEKEKYIADCGVEIGYFPKSADELLENDYKAFIAESDTDENGDYYVRVVVFPQ